MNRNRGSGNSDPIESSTTDEFAAKFELCRRYLLAIANRELRKAPLDCGAEDLVHDTYMAAAKHWKNFRGSSTNELRAWLRAILCRRILRVREKRRKSSAAESAYALVGTSTVDGTQVHEATERTADARQLLAMIGRLPHLKREIVVARLERAESFRQIGAGLGMSEDAVRMAFRRAVASLRRIVGGEQPATAEGDVKHRRNGKFAEAGAKRARAPLRRKRLESE